MATYTREQVYNAIGAKTEDKNADAEIYLLLQEIRDKLNQIEINTRA